jgi:hypothetical protein
VKCSYSFDAAEFVEVCAETAHASTSMEREAVVLPGDSPARGLSRSVLTALIRNQLAPSGLRHEGT